jgi:predicted DsbA family dithiol-disulfide isomerase
MVKLDIISDPICPWCYIGKTLLDQAMAQRPDHPFEIEWHPFQLNPDMPAEGMDRRDYLETKFGGKEGAIRAYAPVLERAEAAGLTIDFTAIKRTPNTLDAHRLLHWAGIEGCQDRMAMALFHAYFNEGRDIGDHEVLADLADSLSLDGAMIQRLLASEADRDAIRARDAQFREMGISGVPTFIVGGQHAVPGCQPADLWVKVIDDLTAAAS